LLLEGDAAVPQWDKRCLERADELLLVAQAGGDPDKSSIERFLPGDRDCAARQVLVLLHPDGENPPSGTKRWLEAHRVERHHHVRLDRDGDVQRLARFVAGRAVGVALGGGGARGFAHIGVLRALAEAGVEIDLIGGTSMGAVIGAEHALGWSEPTMLAKTARLFESWLSDLTLPIVSLLGGHRTARRLRECIPDVQVEDLWLPCFCVSSNLTRADIFIHRHGSLRTAIRASAGLPGILPPVVAAGDLLVDGAFLRNLPVDVVRELSGASTVIAVDVSAPVDLAENPWEGDSLSGWGVLWRRLNPFGDRLRVPNIAMILLRAGEIAGVAAQREMLDTAGLLYWRIPVDRFGLLDFRSARAIVEEGYRVAKERIISWQASEG
jgi:predicted acylesterase/phospholipase RssA